MAKVDSSEIGNLFNFLSAQIKNWQIDKSEIFLQIVENGWYPNSRTLYYHPDLNVVQVNDFMLNHIKNDWDKLKNDILQTNSNRSHILEVALTLHEQHNYIASIPLFLSQADGIACECFKSFLFAGSDLHEKISKLRSNKRIDDSMFTQLFINLLFLKNHYNNGIKKSSWKFKSKAPNRNGILHGYRKHLDYGTEVNSLKCFSLLCYIADVNSMFFLENSNHLY